MEVPAQSEHGWICISRSYRARNQQPPSQPNTLVDNLSTTNLYEVLADVEIASLNEERLRDRPPHGQLFNGRLQAPIARDSSSSPNKKNRRYGKETSNGGQKRMPPSESSSKTSDEANIDPVLLQWPRDAQEPGQSNRLALEENSRAAVNNVTQRKGKSPKKQEAASRAAKNTDHGQRQDSIAPLRGKPAPTVTFVSVNPSSSPPGWDGESPPRTRSVDDNYSRARMKEKCACINCASTKHRCNEEDACRGCKNNNVPCIRNPMKMWLWKHIEIILPDNPRTEVRGINKKTRNNARESAFRRARALLAGSALASPLKVQKEFFVEIRDEFSHVPNYSDVLVSCSELLNFCVRSTPIHGFTSFHSLEELIEKFRYHLKDDPAFNPSWLLAGGDEAIPKLIQITNRLVSQFVTLEALQSCSVFVKSDDADLARSAMIYLSLFFAISIARDAAELLENILSGLRQKEPRRPKEPRRFAETRVAVAFYYRILKQLQDKHSGWNTVGSSPNFMSAIFADLAEEAAEGADKVEELFELTQRLARRNHGEWCRTTNPTQAAETSRKESERRKNVMLPSKPVNRMTLNEYLSEFVPPLCPTSFRISIRPTPGLVQTRVFGNDPIAAEILFNIGGISNLRSRDDLVTVMARQDSGEFPSLESSMASLRDLTGNESIRATKHHDGSSMEAGTGDPGTAGTPTLAELSSTTSTVRGEPADRLKDMPRLGNEVNEALEPKEEVLGCITGACIDDDLKRRHSPTSSWPSLTDIDLPQEPMREPKRFRKKRAVGGTARALPESCG